MSAVIEKIMADRFDELADILAELRQSPDDGGSDGYFDFYFTPAVFEKVVKVVDDESVEMTPKLHLCIHVEDDTGLICYYTNRILANKDHDFVEDCPYGYRSDWDTEYTRVDEFLERLNKKTGIVFDLRGTRPDPFGRLYSSRNLLLLDTNEEIED
jgi:hypothetical protein